MQDVIKVKDLKFELNPYNLNRIAVHKAQADLNRYLHLEEEYWKQKSRMRWFKDGDRNTKFFHSYVKGRRKKLALHSIQNSQGDWINSNNDIEQDAVSFYHNLFSNEEVKLAVFGMNADSTSGPDGFSGHFFQNCWHIIGEDVTKMLTAFFVTGFLKGRTIVENVLLAQEIIRDINKRHKMHNVVVKLDMAKAYDMVSWIFLTKMLRQSHGCFKSSKGLKQGDPLSPTLFIIAAEVLARNLNSLHEDATFKGYGMPKWSPQINHLSYADDTILFCLAENAFLKKMIKVLGDYEKLPGQLVNNEKSSFYLYKKAPTNIVSRVRRKTGMRKGSFPFTYLGCLIFYGRRKIVYYESLIKKVMNMVMSSQNRLLSFGGRYILIAHVLQTMPIYLLSAMNPLKGVINQLHKIFAKFFWSNTAGVKGRHWVAWDKMCLPKDEGGLGFRSLHDIAKALFAKL
ncbi:uncharacterized protein LOC132061439 [Lycium ferocissimum]|uniref:uncharacterized protein LOC132061439 n=1 Tax=Lycium ferocissimum TaxID=112874 RepID=UPI0028157B12|nr:uncharacterized protein LOC132061439 [Lycium ferocissimum]